MAVVDIVMPKMGESIMDGRILKWFKQPGDKIDRDETLFEISTDKVDTEVPSAEGGILVEVLYAEGDTANVGDVVARIETDAANANVKAGVTKADAPKAEVKEEPKQVEKAPEPVKEKEQVPAADTKSGSGSGFYSPLVLNIASKEGVSMDELSGITGTGVGGRVRKQDILAYVEDRKSGKVTKPAPKATQGGTTTPSTAKAVTVEKKQAEYKAPEIHKSVDLTNLYNMPGVDVVPMDTLQSKMAEHMVMSIHTSPHVAAIAECDMSAVDRARKVLGDEFQKREGFKLSYMPFICEAVVKALKDFPLVNASIDGTNILVKSFINLGIAVAMDNGGLIVPVIKNADSKNLTGIAREMTDLAKRARVKKLTLDEIQDGTFTITNYGVFGNIIGTPIINQPQVAILGTGAIKKRAVVVETSEGDAIVIKPMMYLTLSFDHRLIDGALGGKFVMKVVEYLENYTV
ncbi:MAG TPA: dihydrolipoamide acetyltransferase family protein [Ignavibacteria bacterium]|nr:diapophytoene dehydrogenase [Bacteroidota bacterium]HRE09974.1 dihydrolipoamide acetyltransferase family protein [Ignavibacteria bacterium]HRF66958.1 dihydrolipoamide acetyltransferase family protein [Ignavibacteria bacterium]HRJ05636.1 dihydrolipoamide acetyltransferase family protein [Ignavibacteria bacterium]